MSSSSSGPSVARPSSSALKHPAYRNQFISFVVAMMADNIEHVISYWVLCQKFHSPALAGFAVLSTGCRSCCSPCTSARSPTGSMPPHDPGRQVLFMLVSVAWGVLFVTDTLQVWSACVLLVLHGCAGVAVASAEPDDAARLRRSGRSAERGAAQRHRPLSRRAVRSRRSAASSCCLLGPAHGIFVQCAVLPANDSVAGQCAVRPGRFRNGGRVRTRAVRGLGRHHPDDARRSRGNPVLVR